MLIIVEITTIKVNKRVQRYSYCTERLTKIGKTREKQARAKSSRRTKSKLLLLFQNNASPSAVFVCKVRTKRIRSGTLRMSLKQNDSCCQDFQDKQPAFSTKCSRGQLARRNTKPKRLCIYTRCLEKPECFSGLFSTPGVVLYL